MTQYIPQYYNNFKCISDKCKNNCCIGWEIDIDKNTYDKYKNIKGQFGKRLMQNIKYENGVPCFMLKNERCPFLNENNMCDIIINLGSEALCEICDQHPRFHNYYESRIESGIGLCCEEAARVIMTNNKSFELKTKYGDGLSLTDEEKFWFDCRTKLFKTACNRDIIIKERLEQLISFCKIKHDVFDCSSWIEFYLLLERLDKEWTDVLHRAFKHLNKTDIWYLMDKYSLAAEQLVIYFLYRYTPKAVYENLGAQWIMFAVLSCYMIFVIAAATGAKSIDDICNIARMYSAEIEYSDENINMIFNKLAN